MTAKMLTKPVFLRGDLISNLAWHSTVAKRLLRLNRFQEIFIELSPLDLSSFDDRGEEYSASPGVK